MHEHPAQDVVGAGVVLKDAAVRLRVVEGYEGSYTIVLVLVFSALFRHTFELLLKLGSVIAMVCRSLCTRRSFFVNTDTQLCINEVIHLPTDVPSPTHLL